MSTVIFGLYRDREAAERAESALEELQRTDTNVYDEMPHAQEVPLSETDASQGAGLGAVLGAVGGAVAAGLTGGGPLAIALIGAGGGSMFGTLAGALSGLSVPDRTLEAWSDELKRGCVVLSATVDEGEEIHRVESIMLGSGAVQIERANASTPS